MKLMRRYERYRQIFDVLVKYGFEDIAKAFNLKKNSFIVRRLESPKLAALAKLPTEVRVRMILEELGPTFIKFGQILSTREDLIPQKFAQELKKLQDSVPKISYEDIKEVVERETGRNINATFPYFEKNPIASASIGQVHVAKLKSGKRVIVKVQKPNVERIIENDIRILYDVAGILEDYIPEARHFEPRLLVSEFAKTIRREQNYRREGRNATRIRKNFCGSRILYVPEVIWEHNTIKMLVMEYVEGKRFNDYVRQKLSVAARKGLARKINSIYMKMILEDGFFHADPHPGNIIIQREGKISLVDFGMVGYIDNELRELLINLFDALAREDSEKTIELFTGLGMLSEETNIKEFKSNFHEVLYDYYNTELREVRVAEMFRDILEVARVHKVRLPHNFIYLVKVIGEIESICQKLDPDFNLTKNMGPYLKKLIHERFDTKYLVKNISDGLISFNDFVWNTPRRFNNIFDKLEHGKLKMEFEHRGLDQTNRHMENASNKVTLAVIIAAIIVGSSLLIQSGEGMVIYIIGVFGYVFAALLGFWLAIAIMRSGRL